MSCLHCDLAVCPPMHTATNQPTNSHTHTQQTPPTHTYTDTSHTKTQTQTQSTDRQPDGIEIEIECGMRATDARRKQRGNATPLTLNARRKQRGNATACPLPLPFRAGNLSVVVLNA